MTSANEEQKVAIEHNGNMLLRAGAGSGKTFVLVEHIVYLTEKFIEKKEYTDVVDFEIKLKQFYSKIVLMTFTKKAAGEMSIRIKKRFGQCKTINKIWDVVSNCIGYLNVTTIHGFCFKLISSGLIVGIDQEVPLLSSTESRLKIKSLVDNALNELIKDDLVLDKDLIVGHRQEISNGMYKIFSDPTLREYWDLFTLESIDHFSIAKYLQEIIPLLGIDVLTLKSEMGIVDSVHYDKKWYQHLEYFLDILESINAEQENLLVNINKYFEEFKHVTSPPKKLGYIALEKQIEGVKGLRTFLAKNYEALNCFVESKNVYKSWMNIFVNVYKNVSVNYNSIYGITFSDLEYIISKTVKNIEVLERIRKCYQYFIIDEFQDTSFIQFNILKALALNDFQNIFCVGDLKQAIYGFRGGEVAVFKECMKNVKICHLLSNNYRSCGNVINFNNRIFDYLFKLGSDFSGIDLFSVDVDPQENPILERSNIGDINEYQLLVMSEERYTSTQIDQIEASGIIQIIQDRLKKSPNEKICLLYRKLSPLKFLIDELIESNISFIAQTKVKLAHDPILCVFKALLEYSLDEKQPIYRTRILIDGFFSYLEIKNDSKLVEQSIFNFERNQKSFGLKYAFKSFLVFHNIHNSLHGENLDKIFSLIDINFGQVESIWDYLNSSSNETYSIDFRFNANPKIVIMTAHASKGLEFDHVVLAGIHTNGMSPANRDFFGLLPGAIKWKVNASDKKAYSSPSLILENLILKRKEFSESKRLFYVACTRAVKSISWVNVSNFKGELSYSKESWIEGIRKWKESEVSSPIEVIKLPNQPVANKKIIDRPLFHSDNLGIQTKLSLEGEQLGLIAELSVTKLAQIAQCPRKFFFNVICKFEENFEQFTSDEFDKKNDFEMKSDAKRGTNLHSAIEYALKHNMVIPRYIEQEDVTKIQWCLDLISSEHVNFEFHSELPVKFPIFGQMISGTPDLFFLPKNSDNKRLKVWDFKSGQRKSTKESAYWCQLLCYAYGLAKIYNLDTTQFTCMLEILYLDTQEKITKVLTFSEVESELFGHWKRLSNLDEMDQTFCASCGYRNICQPCSLAT
ncbi:MAG: UvrD-helicase domain-containing protein [Halobacteriovoraceae bacterium]|nr:UvrD-helicase domain-containing protein [Halobacteriovoraceae bacterium]